MSLFKVRDIWSIDLEELQRHSSDAQSPLPTSDIDCKAQFIAHIGRFGSIGNQDVFVCGDLRGFIYIIQVPESDQRTHIKSSSSHERPATTASASSDGSSGRGRMGLNSRKAPDDNPERPQYDISERQILAAHDLGTPLVDLKCGFFTSALKQSIAALTYDKLFILQVKPHLVDLISAPNIGDYSETTTNVIDKNLLSHEFEICIKLNLIAGQFAYNLLVLNNHADSALVDLDQKSIDDEEKESSSKASSKFKNASKQIVQQLHLPQRDRIIVQYVDQFLFTLIDNKKITGHFNLRSPECADECEASTTGTRDEVNHQQELKFKQMECSVGCMPIAHILVASHEVSSLVVSLSDYCIYSVRLDKLRSQAKQNVMKRVALDLLGAKVDTTAKRTSALSYGRGWPQAGDQTGAGQQNDGELIHVDLGATSDWSRELMSLPLQMQGVRRRVKSATTSHQLNNLSDSTFIGQLLVMSRYCLDLFSCTGDHLWSQRFEAPLICMHAYTTRKGRSGKASPGNDEQQQQNARKGGAPNPDSTNASTQLMNQQYDDKIISLVCSDNLSDDKCNLIIMSDDQISWSALLNSKPLTLWRIHLSQMPGLLATLDLMGGQLIVSYLGTNHLDSNLDSAQENEITSDNNNNNNNNNQDEQQHLIELERLDETLIDEQHQGASSSRDDLRKRLQVHNSLDAASRDGSVSVSTSIQLDPDSTGVVIHNITITFEYDDLLRIQTDRPDVSYPARGVAQLRLGSCWPDRREPIKLDIAFSLLSAPTSKSIGTSAINELDENQTGTEPHQHVDAKLLPKSLKVHQHLDYNETHSGALHQQHTFLLPISLIAQLTHLDYTSGHDGQELEDVLDNLNQYKGDDGRAPSLYCDLFLAPKCDLMTVLGELIDRDLMCRDRDATRPTMRPTSGQEHLTARRVEILENMNLLAQSLDCRMRFMSPTPGSFARQSSEELTPPVMISFALRLKSNNFSEFAGDNRGSVSDEQVIWVHICDLPHTNNRSKLVEDFLTQHMRDWKNYRVERADVGNEAILEEQSHISISLECDQPFPIILLLDHMIERLRHLSSIDAKLGTNTITGNPGSISKLLIKLDSSNHVAISSKLHGSLVGLIDAHKTLHKDTYEELQSELLREYCKYQVTTTAFLSLTKRLPSLPDEMSHQVTTLMQLINQYNHKLMGILDQLDKLKRRDYAYGKLPQASVLKIELPSTSNIIEWLGFDQIIV